MRYKAVLFDMDGVITDTDHLHFLVWKELMKEQGVNLDEKTYITHLQSRSHEEAITSLLGPKSKEEIDHLSYEKNRRSKALLKEHISVYQDTIDLIKHLSKKGFILAVVSASSNAAFVIEEINMTKEFQLIISGTKDLHLRNKPHPDIYEYAMKRLSVSPKETIIIEDSLSGIRAGLDSGAKVVGINRGNLVVPKTEDLYVTKDLHAIIDWFA